MDDAAGPLKDENLAAAREVLRRFPEFAKLVASAGKERTLAELHQLLGDDRFRLRFGLREPVNQVERFEVENFSGQITDDELDKKLRAHAHRAVDAEMLQMFFTELKQQVQRYSHFMQEVGDLLMNPRRQPVNTADEANVDRLVADINKQSQLFKEEVRTVIDFLQEARIARQLGNVRLGENTTPTAAEMVVLVTHYAQESWKRNQEIGRRSRTSLEHTQANRGVALFGRTMYPSLPRALDLQTAVNEEYALARVYLREFQAAHESNKPAVLAAPPPAEVRLMTVERWSDLAIGVDENWRYWALTPVPEFGEPFRKPQAVELSLPGDRWKAVFEVLAESKTGDVANRADLVQRLGYFGPGTSVERDGRARPGAIEAEAMAEMQERQSLALTQLTQTLADLRRELGELINGPKDRQLICLRTQSNKVRSGFVVRFLTTDAAGRQRFGAQP